MSAIKRDKLDAVVSDLVRERAGQYSEYSGQPGPLEACHIYGRRKKSVRYHPMNLVALTHFEHRHFTEHPLLFAQFIQAKLGPDKYHELCKLAVTPRKFTPRELEGLYLHYKAELERLRVARANGRLGRIEFNFPDPIPEATPRGKAKKKPKSKFKRKLNGQVVPREAA